MGNSHCILCHKNTIKKKDKKKMVKLKIQTRSHWKASGDLVFSIIDKTMDELITYVHLDYYFFFSMKLDEKKIDNFSMNKNKIRQ